MIEEAYEERNMSGYEAIVCTAVYTNLDSCLPAGIFQIKMKNIITDYHR